MKNINEYINDNKNQEMILEMARVGFISKNPLLEIYIHTDDPGNIPHFHIRDYVRSGRSGNEFHTCIQFNSNKYFHHDGKEDVLNSSQRKELVEFLRSNYRGRKGYTNWNKLVDDWNDNNSNMNLEEDINMPDYTTIDNN